MKRSDRLLSMLLMLRGGRRVSAFQIAERFEVSIRTVYRDVDTLSSLGVPIYAERGRGGGFRLLEGYFLPAISFSQDEAVSLLVSLTLLRSLRARPFSAALESAESKLLAAMPEHLNSTLNELELLVGFEAAPADIFHPERPAGDVASEDRENDALDVFLKALLEGASVELRYHSPYREPGEVLVVPLGVFWDRDRWYLAGRLPSHTKPTLWRADRVMAARPGSPTPAAPDDFDVRAMLGRQWLAGAMRAWREDAPVRIAITVAQAERLQLDWYYRHATYEPQGDGRVLMTFGEEDQHVVLELLRWLGPGAELIEPHEWRAALSDELRRMLADHASDSHRNTR